MKQLPKVSVCMITYNHKNFIEDAINGVLMQECDFDIEFILANDCSPDKTDEIVQNIIKTHPRATIINYIKQEQNIGMMPNFIFALQQCHGEYIALCEGDDYWTNKSKLQKQIDFLEANEDYVLCFHPVNILKTDGSIVDDFITKVPKNYETIETLARLGNYIHTPSVVFRNLLKQFPFEFEQTPIGDYFLYMMLAEQGKLKYLENIMAVYRYGVGIHSSNSRLKKTKNNLQLFTSLLSFLKDDKIKKIIFDRQLHTVNVLESLLATQFNNSSNSNNVFFKKIKFILDNFKKPSEIIKKIISKFIK